MLIYVDLLINDAEWLFTPDGLLRTAACWQLRETWSSWQALSKGKTTNAQQNQQKGELLTVATKHGRCNCNHCSHISKVGLRVFSWSVWTLKAAKLSLRTSRLRTMPSLFAVTGVCSCVLPCRLQHLARFSAWLHNKYTFVYIHE